MKYRIILQPPPWPATLLSCWQQSQNWQSAGTPFQSPTWGQMLARSFQHRPAVFCIYAQKEPVALLPLNKVAFVGAPAKWISVSASSTGGFRFAPQAVREEILPYFAHQLRTYRVSYLEIRSAQPLVALSGFSCCADCFVNARLSLQSGSQILWQRFKKNVRNKIRKARQHQLVVKMHAGHVGWQLFHRIYRQTMYRKGTPPFPCSFFQQLSHFFPQTLYVIAYHQGVPVAGDCLLPYQDVLYSLYAGSTLTGYRTAANNYLIWQEITYGVSHGYAWLDLGRSSRHSGTYLFKQQWRPQEYRLYYYCYTPSQQPVRPLDAQSSYYRVARMLLRQMPPALLDWLGRHLLPYLY